MKTTCGISLSLLLVLKSQRYFAEAFAPSTSHARRSSTARAFSPMMDPSHLPDLPNHIQSLQDAFSSISLADLDVDALTSGAASAAADAVQAVDPSGAVAEEAAKSGNGWFGFLTGPTMMVLQGIHSGLVAVGVASDSWGVSIIALTVLIKLLTYPLTKAQLESTNKMQALQPTIKEIQAKYQSNPEVMNQKIAEVYQTNQVNPLAGCIPSLVQIPVFVGLYRAVLDLAQENKLDEPFLWLPSLEGPVYGADPTKGSAWLFEGWSNGVPSLGWEDTISFLVLPVFLILSQYLSMELMTPKEQKAQQPAFLKVLPLMIGWFSLNVPSALCVYWVTNNIITTATSVLIRNNLKMEPVSMGGSTVAPPPPSSSVFAPPPLREKPEGFGNQSSAPAPSVDGVTPITSSSRSAVTGSESEEDGDDDESGEPVAQDSSSKKRGKKKKRRKA
ncbi:membrane protein insertase, YidC/Oxa1 family protein [Nitzschia inconspicua]|uniref:Membrane protein insertase, YidC/Oxa1 family protein n=1 Tax=Nitzschia inconspicua TaxID=303405 RepID=A0A9K3L738_9STRA|nr:membrane protein insertase, YidC/Oxa1 family protein [Nitzschia inconspicua]